MRSGIKRQIVIVRTWDGPASKASSPRLAFGVQDLGCELDRSRLHAFLGSFDNKQEQNELTHKAQHIIPFGNQETHWCHRAWPGPSGNQKAVTPHRRCLDQKTPSKTCPIELVKERP